MTTRYLIQICTPTITEVAVLADSKREAQERIFSGKGELRDQWVEEAYVKVVVELE
ncbi:MAG: hypothetical protein ACI82Z_001399 [Cellvibrionaceae bacterium]|jgi:hypothetical protein